MANQVVNDPEILFGDAYLAKIISLLQQPSPKKDKEDETNSPDPNDPAEKMRNIYEAVRTETVFTYICVQVTLLMNTIFLDEGLL